VIKLSAFGDKMKYTQKTKYFIYGVIATAVLVPLGTYAVKTIPVTFSEGDVISASVMNALMNRIDEATGTLEPDDLLGSWALRQTVPYNGQPGNGSCRLNNSCNITGLTDSADGITRYRNDTVTITKSGATYSFSQNNVASFVSGHTNSAETGTFAIAADIIIFNDNSGGQNFYYAKKKSKNKIILQQIATGSNSFNLIVLEKNNVAPAPADAITATVSGTSVALAWTDQSTDETGFKVQYKTSAKGSWTTATTTAANATSYTISSLTAGKYWIRVVAKNGDGDAISSSEVQAEVQ
jgi:hypothetical protein